MSLLCSWVSNAKAGFMLAKQRPVQQTMRRFKFID